MYCLIGKMLVASLATLGSFARAQMQQLPRVGVVDFASEIIPDAELRLLSDRLRIELFNTGRFIVIERQQMEAILQEQSFQQTECVATECIIEVGQLLGVEKMIAGTVGRVGEVYTTTLRMINVGSGALERTAVKDCRCSLEEVLTTMIAQAAADLAGPGIGGGGASLPLREGYGMLYISSTPPEAQIFLSGAPRNEFTPVTLERIPAGDYSVRLAKGNLFGEQNVTVVRDDLARVHLVLAPAAGTLYITSNPPDAEIMIDGRRVGLAPLVLRDIPSGPRTVRVSKPDHLQWEEQVVVQFNERTSVPVTLQPCGYLDIAVGPPNSVIAVDGNEVSRTGTISRLAVPVGGHRISAYHPDHDSLNQVVTVAFGQVVAVKATLQPLFGKVRVGSSPVGATVVSVPQGISGTTPLDLDHVPLGQYRLEVKKQAYFPWVGSIEVQGANPTQVVARLSPAGYVNVQIEPRNATIFIGGLEITQEDRSSVPVRPGMQRAVAKLADYDSLVQTITVEQGRVTTLTGRMKSKFGYRSSSQRDFDDSIYFGTLYTTNGPSEGAEVTQSLAVGFTVLKEVTDWAYSGVMVNVQYWNSNLIGYRTLYDPDRLELFWEEAYHKDFGSVSVLGMSRACLWPERALSPFADIGLGAVLYAEPRKVEKILKEGQTGNLFVQPSIMLAAGANFGRIGLKIQYMKSGEWSWLPVFLTVNF